MESSHNPVKENDTGGSSSTIHTRTDQENATKAAETPPKNHQRHKRRKKKNESAPTDAESYPSDLPKNTPPPSQQPSIPIPKGRKTSSGETPTPRAGESTRTPEHGKNKKNKKKKPKVKTEETGEVQSQAEGAEKPKTPMRKPKPQGVSSAGRQNRDISGRTRGWRRRVFEEYMCVKDVSDGLKRGQLIQGAVRINPRNYNEAYIPSPDGLADVFLDGMMARNRALNGDVVVVQLLPPDQWKVLNMGRGEQTGSEKKRASESSNPDVTVEAEFSEEEEDLMKKMEAVTLKDTGPTDSEVTTEGGECSENQGSSERNVQRTGKVVYIVEEKHSRAASGFIKLIPDKPFVMFSPTDHRVPRVNVPVSDCPPDFPSRPSDYAQTLFICRITHWPSDNTFAEGRLVRSLGQAGVIEPETEAMLMEYDVDYSDFAQEVLERLPQGRPWTVPPEEIERRRDLRAECVFTIDPATARDLDDALSCKKLPDGNFEVGVHIADVTFFLEEGTALDLVASRRATSVYLVQKVIPMLPRLLCEELCSLNPQTDRLTFSVIWTLSPEGKILSEWFGRTVIRSCVKLSYDHAQSLIDFPHKHFGSDEIPPLSPEHSLQRLHQSVLYLHAIAKHLRAQRFGGGALRLDQMKLSFTLDSGSGMPQGCFIYQYRDSNKLVEEFMLLANMAVAHHIYRSNRELALLRRHAPPQSRLMDSLQELCDHMGLNIDMSSAGALHRSLEEAVKDDEYSAARKAVLTHLCARPMQMAVYFCSGVLKEEKMFHHYALNVPLYTHFTSPIRRYADVIVHRLLAASLKCGPRLALSQEEVEKQACHCNDKKTASKRVQEMSTELFFSIFVRECGPLDSGAMVMGMLDKCFDVLVLQYGVQKRIYCNAIEGLKSYHFCKVGKRPQMILVWAPNEAQKETLTQELSLFSVVDVQLTAAEASLKYTAVLKRPGST